MPDLEVVAIAREFRDRAEEALAKTETFRDREKASHAPSRCDLKWRGGSKGEACDAGGPI
jgi:hypothetical protein